MSISLQRYVNITSGVGATGGVSTRDLNGRFFTTNTLVPTDSAIYFTSASDVATYFGSASTEYTRAVFYFGYVSKQVTTPNQLSFSRWSDVDVASTIYGKVATYAVSTFSSVTTGDFTLTLGGFTHHLTALDTHLAGSLSAVAGVIQTAVRAYSAGGTAWTAATITYDSTRKSFNLVSGLTGDDTISVLAGVTVDMASLIGWLTGAIFSDGQDEQTVTDVLTAANDANDNFGSFAFVPTLTLDQVTEAAVWNNALDVKFMYSVPVSAANSAAWNAALIDIGGITLSLSETAGEYPEQDPMMMLGATNYAGVNSVINYMFNSFNQTPSVTSNADADTYDALRINYYGQTQTAGQLRSFYQRGVMFGLPVDPQDQNTYANELWLKDAAGAALMSLLLTLSRISANSTGRSQVLAIIQGIINQAITNGTISVGKPLTDTQKAYITTLTGDNLAWQQVQYTGYWVDAEIIPYTEDSVTKYKIVYTLIYSKDDIIRKIDGRDILI